jgi:hypothetical protein
LDAHLDTRIPGQTAREEEWKKMMQNPMPIYTAHGPTKPSKEYTSTIIPTISQKRIDTKLDEEFGDK